MIKIKLCGNLIIQLNLSKNSHFSTKKAIDYIPLTEKRKKVPVCEMLESFGSLSSSMFPISSWKMKIIPYRDRSKISTSSKLELFCQYEITSGYYIVTTSFIIDDVEVRDPPLVSWFSAQNITKNIKV